MKKFSRLIPIFIVSLFIVAFSSCGDDDDNGKPSSGSISGFWSAPNGTYKGQTFILVYNFINKNTVVDYSTVSNSASGWTGDVATVPNHSGWYYSPSSMRNLTYVIADNKIIISDGTILTITANGLLEDGSSVVYTKW